MAEKMDYQPNLLAYGLAKSKSLTIGIIVPEFINSFFPQVIIGAQDVANPAGYHVIICHSNESVEREIENTNVLMANRVGREGDLTFWGGSRALDPFGRTIAQADGNEALVVAELDRSDIDRARDRLPTVRDSNPALVQAELGRWLRAACPQQAR